MFDLKKLEINRLIKEFEYIKSDYEYKSEVIKEADSKFLESVDKILNINDELKSIYKEKVDIKLNNIIERKSENIHNEKDESKINSNVAFFEETSNQTDFKSNKIKRLFYQIAKLTHPDKIDQERLNTLYIEASKYYEISDIIGIYKICDELFINYDIEQSDIELIRDNINDLKERISFIENTFSWKWYNSETNIKNKMALKYIRKQIIYQDI